jgi:hypothetical protein
MRSGTLGVEVDDDDVAQLWCPGDQGIEQDRRRRGGPLKVDRIAAPDRADGFSGRDDSHIGRVG